MTAKKTDLLTGFVSQRTRRKFSAYLVMAADGKTSFEFEPRKEGAGKKPFPKKPVHVNGANLPKPAEGEEAKAKPVAKTRRSPGKKAPKPTDEPKEE